jgi:ubiquinone/menaquinone biosynthesis C-methylase UbiE
VRPLAIFLVKASPPVIWIGYTTKYRKGGPKFERAARTLEREKRSNRPDLPVRCEPIESKRDFVAAMARIRSEGREILELHLLSHSGMYGPMFNSVAMPEQFSPHEWRQLPLPFAAGAEAFFHACRTARWFAPFFARTFNVVTYGYHYYTTVSTAPGSFRWQGIRDDPEAPLYIISCAGRKSHGLLGSVMKYTGRARAEPLLRFEPEPPEGDTTYNSVAELYDAAFDDITVRAEEWRWITSHLAGTGRPRVLDIGCGNGALLQRLEGRISSGTGVDPSAPMIDLARRRCAHRPELSFHVIDGPSLPFPDASFDVVTSLLSFRYLDWDPIMNEIRRVLAPGGRILIVDMVTVPLRLRDLRLAAGSKLRQLVRQARNRRFAAALRRLTRDPRWAVMLKYNPIRAEHELKWYLESRFPGCRVETLTIGWNTRILAADTGPLQPGQVAPQSYP